MADGTGGSIDTGDLVAGGGASSIPNTPGNGFIDLPSLMAASTGAVNSFRASQADADAATASARRAAETDQAGIEASTTAKQAINDIEGAANATRQAHNDAASTAWGTNPNAANYVIDKMGTDILEREQDIAKRQDMITAKLDVNFLDDPLQWVVNQFTVPFDQQALEGAQAAVDEKKNVATMLLAKTTQIAASNAIIDEASATKVAAQKNAELAGQAMQQVAKSQTELARLGLTAASIKNANSRDSLDALMRYQSAVAQNAQLQMEREKVDIAKESLEINRAYKDLQTQAAADNLDAKRQIQAKLVRLQQLTGGQNPTTYAEYASLPANRRAALDDLMSSLNFEEGRVANSPSEVLEAVTKSNLQLPPGAMQVINKLRDLKDATIAQVTPIMWNTMKEDTKQNAINNYVKQESHRELSNIPTENGLYSPPSLLAVIAANKYIGASPISQALAGTATLNDGRVPADPSVIVNKAVELAISGKMSPAEAADNVNQIYKGVLSTTNEIRQFKLLSLPTLSPATTGYNTTVRDVNGNSAQLNMLSKPQLEAYITRRILMSKLGGMPPMDILGGPLP
jgi:hypothetical protein